MDPRPWLRTTIYVYAALLLARGALAEQLPIRGYGAAEGLAGNSVLAMRDSQGFLWISTNEGLSKFDGYDFTNFGRLNGLPRDRTLQFLEMRDDVYWAVTSEGVARVVPNPQSQRRFISYRPNIPADRKIYTLFEARDGRLWCGTEDGIFILRPRSPPGSDWTFERVPMVTATGRQASDSRAISFYEDRRGDLWIGSIRALYRRDSGGRMFEYALDSSAGDWTTVTEDAGGNLWGGTHTGIWRIVRRTGDRYEFEPALVPKPQLRVRQFLPGQNGKLLAATSSGLLEWTPEEHGPITSFRFFNESNGFTRSDLLLWRLIERETCGPTPTEEG